MYGLVNKTIGDLVKTNFGADSWELITEKANVKGSSFESASNYHDHITYDLLHAAVEVLGMDANSILFAFGEYWVLYAAAEEGHEETLKAAGNSFPEFLPNLNDLHVRVKYLMPELQPPTFECSDMQERSMLVHYYSHRKGLTHLVRGLLSGLGKRFNTPCETVVLACRDKGEGDHDIIKLTW
jgi:hypothetical protein